MDSLDLIAPDKTRPLKLDANRRALLGGIFFSGYALASFDAKSEPITTDSNGLVAKNITFAPATPEGDYQIPGFIAFPDDGKKHRVIIVVSEVFGVHDYIRDICRRLAKVGYCAIAPDFFARKGNAAEAKTFDEVKALVEAASLDQVMNDIRAAITFVKSKPDLGQLKKKQFAKTDRFGITGFCWGGAVTWMAANLIKDIKAGVAWYGRLERPAPDQFMGAEDRKWPFDYAATQKVPVLGLYGGQDQGIPLESVERQKAELAKGKSKSEFVIYPDAPHAFHADYRKSYVGAAAVDGWNRLLLWFATHLR